MSDRISIVYNDPALGRLHNLGESDAVMGVLEAVDNVSTALRKLGYEPETVRLQPPLSLAKKHLAMLKADIVFNLFEGFDGIPGSEATIAQTLEKKGTRFTGSPSRALMLSENKAEEKKVLRDSGVPTPDSQLLSPETISQFNLKLPCIIKPLGQHASHGISEESVVGDFGALRKRVEFVFASYSCFSLVEEFVSGREFSALVVGNEKPKLFPIEEIVYALPPGKPHILTYAAKWVPGHEYFTGTKIKCPADVTPEVARRVEELAIRSFTALGCRGYARVDMRQARNGNIMVLEVNPNPDISSAGGARMQAEAAGLDYVAFINEILSLATSGG